MFHPCGYHLHDTFAEYILKMSATHLTDRGWARLDKSGYCLQELNPEQRRWLENVAPDSYPSRIS